MKKSRISIIALLLIAAALLMGCNKASQPPKVIFVDGYADAKTQELLFGKAVKDHDLPIICIDNMAAMDEFNQTAREQCYTVEGTNGEPVELPTVNPYNEAVAPYTEDFFKEKSLIVTYIWVNANPAEFEVSNISISDGKLTVLVDAFGFGVNAASTESFIFIEIPKSDLEGVTEFSAMEDMGEIW